jgi:hypothetical protein
VREITLGFLAASETSSGRLGADVEDKGDHAGAPKDNARNNKASGKTLG